MNGNFYAEIDFVSCQGGNSFTRTYKINKGSVSLQNNLDRFAFQIKREFILIGGYLLNGGKA